MYFSIEGKLNYKDYEIASINTGGVSFEIKIPLRTFFNLPEIGENTKLYTIVLTNSENNFEIYGFETLDEKRLFSKLIRIMGVGPKTALSLFSKMEYNEIVNAIENNEISSLSSVPGIGKKTAGRIFLEFSGKLVKEEEKSKDFEDVVLALQSLGYKKKEAEAIVNSVLKEIGNDLLPEEVLKESLKRLAEK